eukprot:UN11503
MARRNVHSGMLLFQSKLLYTCVPIYLSKIKLEKWLKEPFVAECPICAEGQKHMVRCGLCGIAVCVVCILKIGLQSYNGAIKTCAKCSICRDPYIIYLPSFCMNLVQDNHLKKFNVQEQKIIKLMTRKSGPYQKSKGHIDETKCWNPTCKISFVKSRMKCMGCKKIYYCSKSCQKQDWNIHKLECRKLRC